MIIRPKAGFRDVLLAVRGSTAQRIALRCGLMTLLACGAVYWAQYLPVALSRLGIAPFTLIGMAISTFLGFRNSACHTRWWERRQQWGPPQVWRSGGNRLRMRGCIIGWVEFLSVAGTERAVVDRAANLEQEIGPSSFVCLSAKSGRFVRSGQIGSEAGVGANCTGDLRIRSRQSDHRLCVGAAG
jgi:hypothetical protein